MISLDSNNTAIILVKCVTYCCIIYGVSKSDTIYLVGTSQLEDRRFTYKYISKRSILKIRLFNKDIKK